ncbi:hypothetical protein CMO93_02330 [Candidatus Woesearchaeota archaeon]|nr:hypothetical protein [Candidatus Woesearchaeota archaeon]|tara:strand:- start:5350 stop:5733 length:384 start_codon:yes stop_codon:yes gene_type:complete
MEQHSLERINHSQIKDFFRSLCIVGNRYEKKEHPVYENLQHLEKKHFKKPKAITEKEPKNKMKALEQELQEVKNERDEAVGENRKQIHELNVALLSIKTRMNEILEHKKEREKRVKELEEKIRKKVH